MNIGESIGLVMGKPTRNAFGEALRQMGDEFADLVVVDADVGNSTRTEWFGQAYPERFLQVGIAESNLVGVAAGLAATGRPALCASFAAFLTCNAFDQIRMSVGFPRANVKLVGSHAGISIGEDGPSQMGIEDIALMRAVPNMVVLAPADEHSAAILTRRMLEHDGPVYMRTGRPEVPLVYDQGVDLRIGRAMQLREGTDVTLIACGLMVAMALEAAADLENEDVSARVIDMHTIKPLDEDAVASAVRDTGAIVTAEEHLLNGGLGDAVAAAVVRRSPCPMRMVGLDDTYAESGPPVQLLERYDLTPAAIARAARAVMRERVQS